MTATKVIILTRVSSNTDRQDVERQILELKTVCEHKKWEVVQIIEAKVSATKVRIPQRKDVKELVDAVLHHRPHKVLVAELSRVAREPRELDWIIDFLKENNVSLFLNNFGIESIPDDAKLISISAMVFAVIKELCKMEVDQLSQRIRSGLELAKKKGTKLGRPTGGMDDKAVLEKYKSLVKRMDANPDMSDRDLAALEKLSPSTVGKVRSVKLRKAAY